MSINREMRRIVDGLRDPDQLLEQLLEVLTVRRADGREISLEELPVAQALGDGETVRAEEIELRRPDGRTVRALLNGTPIRSRDGRMESFVAVLQDMTPFEEQERLRAEFLAMMSHELRSPLASIKGSISTLLDPPAPLDAAEAKQFHQIIDSQIDRMQVLISDLLDVARIESGTLAFSPEPTDVAHLVGEAQRVFREGSGGREATISLAADLPWVMADKQRMIQVLSILLFNAARNSPQSSSIKMCAAVQEVHVAISVSDQGRGIPAESLPRIFQKSIGEDAEAWRSNTGLGLAISKGIVEAHGGRIWAESDGHGLGARITFTLPTMEQAGNLAPAAVSPSATSIRGRRAAQIRVLAVDDDPQALRHVQDALIKSDFVPLVTHDPAEVPRLVADERPHLVLLDLMIPGTDGIELMQHISGKANVPVIFLAGYGPEKLVAEALDSGAADYLVKPFSPIELATRIKAALRRWESPEQIPPYVLGGLSIDFADRLVSHNGQPVQLTDIEFRTLAELASNSGRTLSYGHLLRRVWRAGSDADIRPIRTAVSSLRKKLRDDAENPNYIFTELRVGYRMPKGDATEPEEG